MALHVHGSHLRALSWKITSFLTHCCTASHNVFTSLQMSINSHDVRSCHLHHKAWDGHVLSCKENLTLKLIARVSTNNEYTYQQQLISYSVLFSAAPTVTFADIPEKDLYQSVVEQEELVLSCEVSRADGVVQWYRDGTEMQPGKNVTIQAEGTKRNMTVHSAQLSDMGTYTCRAGDNTLMFKVTVRGKTKLYLFIFKYKLCS